MSSFIRILGDERLFEKNQWFIPLEELRHSCLHCCCSGGGCGSGRLPHRLLEESGTTTPSYDRMATNEPENFPPGHHTEMPRMIRTLKRFTSKQLEDYTDKRSNLLGSGRYGKVYKGELLDKTPVAVKMLMNAHDKETEQLFMEEVALLCIHYKPDMRPEMSRVVKMLEGEIEIPEPEYPFEDTNPDQPSQDSGDGSEGDSGLSL
ncbi:hypothetical protein NL676_010886 [Syzygium grande]|nr:hypothetical protein NL676_010886 [Syzygium grande]